MSKLMRIVLCALLGVSLVLATACGDDSPGSQTNNESTANNGNNGNNGNTCPTGEEMCDSVCVDTSSSNAHCGTCGNSCVAGQNTIATCNAGSCDYQCEPGFIDSDDDLANPNGNGCDYTCEETNGGVELCDGLDNDCDGQVDEDFADVNQGCEVGEGACKRSGTYICSTDASGVECDATAGTPEDEVCGDSVDNDCDAEVDEGDAIDATTWYQDQDSDGYGNDGISEASCSQPTDFIDQPGDCDDSDAQRHPDADEVCDGVDNNCDGDKDEAFPDKGNACTVGQGVCQNSGQYVCTTDGSGTECSASPGSPQETVENTCDALDNDCDGDVDEGCDDDNDGWCEDSFTVTANATVCSNGTQTGDCDDSDDTMYPGAPGLCDNKDNDCDGGTDELDLITTNPTSFTMTARKTTTADFPPPVLSAPAGDGFCVLAFDDTNNILEHGYVRADGTHAFDTWSSSVNIELMDIAWNGQNCGALFRYDNGSLWFFEWGTNGQNNGFLNVTTDLVTANDANVANAALMPYESCNSLVCFHRWLFAYVAEKPSSTNYHRLVYSTSKDQPNVFNDSPTAEQQISGFVDSNTDVELGPSPNSSDAFAVVYKDGSTIKVVTAVTVGGSTSFRTGLSVSSANNYEHFTLADLNGTVYLTYGDSSNNAVRVREMTSNYQYDLYEFFPGGGDDDFLSRYPLAEGINGSFGWFMQAYVDELYTLRNGYCDALGAPTSPILGDPCILSTSVPNSNFGPGDQLLATSTRNDVMQVLRLAYTNPFRLEVDEYTCY